MKNKNLVNNIFSLITVSLFVAIIITVCVLFFVLPKKERSEIERRELTKFPEFSLEALAEGSYTDNITKYVSDNFIARDKLVELSYSLEDARGIRVDGVKIYNSETADNNVTAYIDKPFSRVKKSLKYNESSRIVFDNSLAAEEKPSELIDFDDVVENSDIYKNLNEDEITGQKVGALFIVNDTALEIFYGNSSIINDYVNIINSFRITVPSHTNVYNMVVPTHFEFGLPEKYRSQVGNLQKPYIDELYSSLSPDIITVDAYSKIKNDYFKGNYMYFRTDHHWTARGAYSAYEAFAEKAGFEKTPLSEFEVRKVDRFLGTFYSATYDKKLSANPDFVKYYAPKNNYTVTNYDKNGNITTTNGYIVANRVSGDSNGYLVFMGGDIPLSVIETDAGTGRSIIVFKESYGNAFIPFLAGNFDKIYVADIRTFPFNAVNFVNENEISDVLFLNNIITACSPPRIKNYLDLMQKAG